MITLVGVDSKLIAELVSLDKTWNTFLHNCFVRAYFDVRNDYIVLEQIYVPARFRRSGYGSAIMDELTTIADAFGKKIMLTPDDCFGVPISTLKKFYASHGFVQYQLGKPEMVREPNRI